MTAEHEISERIRSYGENLTEMPFIGLPTLLRTEYARDWTAVAIGLIGVSTDAGLTHRPGAQYGPPAVRAQIPFEILCLAAKPAAVANGASQ